MGPQVMIVEDNKELLKRYRNALHSEGYRVRPVSDMKLALELFEREPTEVVLLEAQLLKDDDFCCLEKFLNIKRDVRIVINSCYQDYEMNFRSWAADAFMKESMDSVDLRNYVHRFLS